MFVLEASVFPGLIQVNKTEVTLGLKPMEIWLRKTRQSGQWCVLEQFSRQINGQMRTSKVRQMDQRTDFLFISGRKEHDHMHFDGSVTNKPVDYRLILLSYILPLLLLLHKHSYRWRSIVNFGKRYVQPASQKRENEQWWQPIENTPLWLVCNADK